MRGHAAIALAQIGSRGGFPYLEQVLDYTRRCAEERGDLAERRMVEVCRQAIETLKKTFAPQADPS